MIREDMERRQYYCCIYLEGPRKAMNTLSHDMRSPGRDLNPGPPLYEAGALTTWPRRPVLVQCNRSGLVLGRFSDQISFGLPNIMPRY
jgi:hypothetical protein